MDVYEFLQKPSPDVYKLPHITLDCETTNINYGDSTKEDNRVLLTSYYDETGVHSVWGGLAELAPLISRLEDMERFIVGHNIKFDLRWLARYGLDLSKVVVWDTMIAEHIIYGNRPSKVGVGLGVVAQRYGLSGKEPYIDIAMKKGVCPSELPTSLLQRRCEYDISVTELIFREQYKRLEAEDKLKTMLTRCLLTPVLADIEAVGLQLDKAVVEKEYYRAMEEQHEIQQALSSIADINWNSPKQVGELLYDELGFKELADRKGTPIRTPSGSPKADVATIQALSARTKQQKSIQLLMKRQSVISAQLSKTLTKFKACVDNGDLLYAQFNQAITQTHRLSSTGTEYGVQFQNMPRIFKPCVKARNKGWHVCEADGAQLEFRVAAFLGQDQQAIYDIVHGTDIHQYTADTISGAGQETCRQDAKAHTFKPLFGGRSGTKAEKSYYAAFKEKYSGVTKQQEAWKMEAMRTKKFRIPSGLEFFFPNIRVPRTKDGYIPEESNIYNYPIQSFATADIIPVAIVYLWHEMRAAKMESFIFNTVHDSVICELKPEETEQFNQYAIASFGDKCYNYLKAVYNVEFNVPLGCGIKIGTHWGTGEEISYELPTPYDVVV